MGIAGETGLRLARVLKNRGDEVDGLYRRAAQAKTLADIAITGTLGDLVQMDGKQLAEALRGSDVIVFTAGAGAADSDAMTDAIDGNGVTKSIAAAHIAGVRRLILVSVFPEAWRERHMDESLEHYVELAHSDLNWVILRPSALTNEPGVGTVQPQCRRAPHRDPPRRCRRNDRGADPHSYRPPQNPGNHRRHRPDQTGCGKDLADHARPTHQGSGFISVAGPPAPGCGNRALNVNAWALGPNRSSIHKRDNPSSTVGR